MFTPYTQVGTRRFVSAPAPIHAHACPHLHMLTHLREGARVMVRLAVTHGICWWQARTGAPVAAPAVDVPAVVAWCVARADKGRQSLGRLVSRPGGRLGLRPVGQELGSGGGGRRAGGRPAGSWPGTVGPLVGLSLRQNGVRMSARGVSNDSTTVSEQQISHVSEPGHQISMYHVSLSQAIKTATHNHHGSTHD
eukprot:269674-Chlamydomonas_euryale.AAC.3